MPSVPCVRVQGSLQYKPRCRDMRPHSRANKEYRMDEAQPTRLGPDAVVIKTLMSDQGVCIVGIQTPSTNLIVMPDAAAHIALELLAAAYAARSEDALHKAMREKGLE